MSGLKLSALYGWKPHQLGFCGPKDNGDLLKYLKGKNISKKKIINILEQFEGMYPYYEKIARKNNIENPFDEQIARAYWVGNNLLKNDYKLHHSYHVLVVGSVTNRIKLTGELLDICRVSWGEVIKLKENLPAGKAGTKKLIVKYQLLVGKKKLSLGKPIEKEIDWDLSVSDTDKLKVGDWISFHWNQAVEILNKEDILNLEKYTRLTLNSL